LINLSRSSRTRARFFNFSNLTADRDRTVSRRSKPSSRTILTVEQTDPWKIILNQDMMSRHRGANRLRRWELLGVISLLSLAYLLSVNRYLYQKNISGHYDWQKFYPFKICRF
jgi:hypothetical protein